jgi:hypothetical protein
LKKTHSEGYLAQKAIRYLDQRLKNPSPFLIGQKPEEESAIESAPRPFQRILGSCLFYLEKSGHRLAGDFFLITEDEKLTQVAVSFGIRVVSPLLA